MSELNAEERLTNEELFELLLRRVGFNPDAPGWTPALVDLHKYSVGRKLQIVPEHFYTPVYSPASLPESTWTGRLDAGVDYDVERQLEFVARMMVHESELRSFDVDPPPGGTEERRFYWSNSQFGHGDAALYYSLLRTLSPRHVVEIGGGYSTLLASEAAARGGVTAVDCIEPYPRGFLESGLPGVNVIPTHVQDVPPAFFEVLEAGDVLFIDGSHVCKTGSDVNHVLLRVLPSLRAGVFVHLHDIFLPFEYPRDWADQLLYWSEQYVVAALLSGSRKFELAAANYFLSRVGAERLAETMPKIPGVLPGGTSYWIRSVE